MNKKSCMVIHKDFRLPDINHGSHLIIGKTIGIKKLFLIPDDDLVDEILFINRNVPRSHILDLVRCNATWKPTTPTVASIMPQTPPQTPPLPQLGLPSTPTSFDGFL